MTVTASIRVKAKRRQKCPYCGATYFFDTSPQLVQETAFSEEAAKIALLNRVNNLKTFKNALANAPCPCCGRIQKEVEGRDWRRSAGVIFALTLGASAAYFYLAGQPFEGGDYSEIQAGFAVWAILAVALTAFGFYASRDANKRADARRKKFVAQPQNWTAEHPIDRLPAFDFQGRRCFVAEESTVLPENQRNVARVWPFAARILFLAGTACGLVAAALWTEKTFTPPVKPAPYQDSFVFDVPFEISGESLKGYCRVAERELTVKTADGEEVADVEFTFGGESDWGEQIQVSETYWGPEGSRREIDPYKHIESYRVTSTARLGENRALAGKTVICEGTVEVESPRLVSQMVREAQLLLGRSELSERSEIRLNWLRLHLLLSMERELGENEELDDYIMSLNSENYKDTFYNDFDSFTVRTELTVPEDFADREGYEAKMAKYEADQKAYETSREARKARVGLAKTLTGLGCVAFAICAILFMFGSASACPKEERSEAVGVSV